MTPPAPVNGGLVGLLRPHRRAAGVALAFLLSAALGAPEAAAASRAVLHDCFSSRACGTIIDVDRYGKTLKTKRNKVLGATGRVLPGDANSPTECKAPHFHGSLLGERDPQPRGCGWGSTAPFAAMSQVGRRQSAAITSELLALRARSITAARAKVKRARRHLRWVRDYQYGLGDEAFEETEEAASTVAYADGLLKAGSEATTTVKRVRSLRRARSAIRQAISLTRSAVGAGLS